MSESPGYVDCEECDGFGFKECVECGELIEGCECEYGDDEKPNRFASCKTCEGSGVVWQGKPH